MGRSVSVCTLLVSSVQLLCLGSEQQDLSCTNFRQEKVQRRFLKQDVTVMAGSGVALRLHEFKEFLHNEPLDGQNRASRQGRDTRGLYPGQLGRVHAAHLQDYGFDEQSGRSQSVSVPPNPNSHSSFDVQTLRAVSVRFRHEASAQRPLQTTYQEHFGLQSSL